MLICIVLFAACLYQQSFAEIKIILQRAVQSDSFADFWARRWNLTTTYMMRTMLYEPIMEGGVGFLNIKQWNVLLTT
jgi:hypothetical protein